MHLKPPNYNLMTYLFLGMHLKPHSVEGEDHQASQGEAVNFQKLKIL